MLRSSVLPRSVAAACLTAALPAGNVQAEEIIDDAAGAELPVFSSGPVDAEHPEPQNGLGQEERPLQPTDLKGFPADLSALDRAELEGLAQDLALQNLLLQRRMAEAQQKADQASPKLEAEIDRLNALTGGLREQLRQANASLAAAQNRPPAPTEPEVEQEGGGDADDQDEWTYRFSYEFGLIRRAGEGRITLRDQDGERQAVRYSYEEYRNDALWVRCFFRNTSDRALRFSGLMALGGQKPLFAKVPPRLATVAFTTPVLAPGEIYDLSRDVPINDPQRVWSVDVGEVKAHEPAAADFR